MHTRLFSCVLVALSTLAGIDAAAAGPRHIRITEDRRGQHPPRAARPAPPSAEKAGKAQGAAPGTATTGGAAPAGKNALFDCIAGCYGRK